MQPLIASFPIEAVLGISIPFVAGVIVLLTMIVTHHLRRLQRDDMEATLKMEMIQRGMSAPEIEQVLAARLGQWSSHHRNRRGQQQQQHQHQHQTTSAAPR